jgi:hypothetical protein
VNDRKKVGVAILLGIAFGAALIAVGSIIKNSTVSDCGVFSLVVVLGGIVPFAACLLLREQPARPAQKDSGLQKEDAT